MLHYKAQLKHLARPLRKNMTDSERVLWSRLRRKQLLGMQFYRQRPIGRFIVDYYAPKKKLVIEVDGSQHMEDEHIEKDKSRDDYLNCIGLKVLRFNSREVLEETDAIVEKIYQVVVKRMKNNEIPLGPPLE